MTHIRDVTATTFGGRGRETAYMCIRMDCWDFKSDKTLIDERDKLLFSSYRTRVHRIQSVRMKKCLHERIVCSDKYRGE